MTGTTPSEPFALVHHGTTELTLLGTAHVSRASAEEVRTLLGSGKFDAVAVELCPSRYNALINPDALSRLDLLQVVRSGKAPMVIAQLALSAFQQRIASEVGVEPGAEMRTAVALAREQGLPVLLIDREIGITLKRIYGKAPFVQRAKLLGALLTSIFSRDKVSAEDIERLKQGDILETALRELASQEATLFSPLIAERDRYMAARLRQELQDGRFDRVLTVIGAGHLPGIQRELLQQHTPPQTIAAELETLPPPSRWVSYLGWAILLAVAVGFLVGFMRSPAIGWELVKSWILITGTLSALGTLAALGHPLTILSAFVAAPITTLNPAISAGMITGTVELLLRKPAVADFVKLREDVMTWRGWWRNGVARVLLVFFLSSLGAAIGTYAAGLRLFEQLSRG
jgi:pheromone shutdown-related protein TraB